MYFCDINISFNNNTALHINWICSVWPSNNIGPSLAPYTRGFTESSSNLWGWKLACLFVAASRAAGLLKLWHLCISHPPLQVFYVTPDILRSQQLPWRSDGSRPHRSDTKKVLCNLFLLPSFPAEAHLPNFCEKREQTTEHELTIISHSRGLKPYHTLLKWHLERFLYQLKFMFSFTVSRETGFTGWAGLQ